MFCSLQWLELFLMLLAFLNYQARFSRLLFYIFLGGATYQAYNPKAADRLGIVYTPNEIVRFMVESVDYLTHKHFGKLLADKDVHIIEPAVGTGTFVTELIEYIPK
ncbi:MAG: hypothetical protein RLZZ171_2143, partial [Cyanobacteriota bacterium]